MGKTGWPKQWRGADEHGASDYWQWQPPKQGKGGQNMLEVRYDQIKLEDTADTHVTGVTDAKAADGQERTLAQVVQKAVNAARKAGAKCKKLEEEMTTRKKKWDAYQQQVQAAFRKQHTQFVEDLNRLEGELEQAQENAELADSNLKKVLKHSGSVPNGVDDYMMAGVEEETDPWEDFVRNALAAKTKTTDNKDKEVASYLQAAAHRAAQATMARTKQASLVLQAKTMNMDENGVGASVGDGMLRRDAGMPSAVYGPSPTTRAKIMPDPYSLMHAGSDALRVGECGPVEVSNGPITPTRKGSYGPTRTPGRAARVTREATLPAKGGPIKRKETDPAGKGQTIDLESDGEHSVGMAGSGGGDGELTTME